MKIIVENLGAVKQAELDMGKLTIICGKNNSGKTYVTYALYGFLDYWHRKFNIEIDKTLLMQLKNNGVLTLSLTEYTKKGKSIIKQACEEFTKILSTVYSAQEKLFVNSSFDIQINDDELTIIDEEYDNGIQTAKTKLTIFTVKKEEKGKELIATLFSGNSNEEIPDFILSSTLSSAIKEIVFGSLFPNCFIASAERTGAALFRNELNLARNRLLNKVLKKDTNINPLELIKREQLDYALPVEDNIEFTRSLEHLSNTDSYIIKEHENLINKFADILGGKYQVSKNDNLYFIPNTQNVKLTMDESSSSVRSLLEIGFYLKHSAKKNDLLMIDEPELNLHPENQRKIARLIACLINCGLKIFITTHSDYILKELSTLIMLNSDKEHILELAKREGYSNDELLNVNDLKVYVAKTAPILLKGNKRKSKIPTLTAAHIDCEFGIEASSFDDTINDMNRIQDEIIYGG